MRCHVPAVAFAADESGHAESVLTAAFLFLAKEKIYQSTKRVRSLRICSL